jgi:starch synthase
MGLNVLFATSEIAPWVKTGGLGDVAGALPLALRALGADVRVLVPGYHAVRNAFPRRTPLAAITHPAGALPASTLCEASSPEGLPLLIIDCAALYDRPGGPYQTPGGSDWPDNLLRFGLLSKIAALLASDASPLAWRPQVLHCNDWQTGLAPAYLAYRLPGPAPSVMTIHNLSFQGVFPPASLAPLDLPTHAFGIDGVEYYGQLSFLKAGLQLATRITTVSPTYAREIQTPEFGYGMEGLLRFRAADTLGILNGIDDACWNPATDPLLPATYQAGDLTGKALDKAALQQRLGLAVEPGTPLLGAISRLTWQKGLDLLLEIGDALVADGAQLALLGSGDAWMQDAFTALSWRHPGRVAVIIGYDEALAHQIEAGADVFLIPSRFEPCGLNQMYSLRYGTPPLVRATGGLGDVVIDATPAALAEGRANGFVFGPADAPTLLATIRRVLAAWQDRALWQRLQATGMAADWSWAPSARRYLELYESLVA